MQKVVLHIENSNESKTIELGEELTIGRTEPSNLVLDDSGLSRKNTTIFRDGELVLVADENSTNGTFLNGRRISGPPQELQDGDKLAIGETYGLIRYGSRLDTYLPAGSRILVATGQRAVAGETILAELP